jgi:hypothetical protein
MGPQSQAAAVKSQLRAIQVPAIIQPWVYDGELTTKDFALGFLTSDQHL